MTNFTKGRAVTYEQKKQFLEELFRLWGSGNNKHLRFGQLIVNAVGADPFYIEDQDFLAKVDDFCKKDRKYITDTFKDGEIVPLEEGYIIFGTMTAEEAQTKIHEYEKKECGIGEDEGVTDPADLTHALNCEAYEDPEDASMQRFDFKGREGKGRECWYILF